MAETTKNDDLKLKLEQIIDEIKNEAYQRGSEDAWKRIVDVRSKDIECGYNRGLNDAWKCGIRITNETSVVLSKIFGEVDASAVFQRYTPQEAMQKIKDYERRQKLAEQAKRGKEHRNEIGKMLEEKTKRTCDNCSHPKYGCQECGEDLDNWKPKQIKPKYENCKKCRRLIELNDCHMEGCCGWYYYEPMSTKDNYVDAIVKVRVPKWQIGEKVDLYFKDTMHTNGICEADKK